MFDDHTNSSAGGTVPSNLPMGEPDDMFAGAGDIEPAIPQGDQVSSLPPTALDAGVLRAKAETVPPELVSGAPAVPSMTPRRESLPSMPVTMPMNANSDGVLAAPLGGHKALITTIVLLSVIIVGGGSVWAYYTFINPKDVQVLPVNNAPVLVTSTTVVVPENQPTTTTSGDGVLQDATSTDNRILFGEPILDTDGDGLDDSVEKEKGTNMLAWDTDGDTLSDGDEVLTWKTNPLKADTDSDTYDDAAEIKNGYNPNGEGKLFVITTSTNSGVTTSTQTDQGKT